MIRKIMKRDGKVVDFNPIKITNAIWKAAQAVGGKDYRKAAELTDKVIQMLEKELKRGEIPTVELVQDIVEKTLIEEGHAKTAKAYILYRKQHQDMREVAGLLKDIDVVDDYLSMMDWKVQENSNMSYSLQGLNVYATENIISHYWLNKIYPPEIGEAHINGKYHIHDLGTLGAYCVGWDLKDILLLGFKGVSGKIESKPAKHFSTALMQIVNYLYTLQGEAAGAQALSNFDSLLAPFIRYDNLKYKDVKQEMQKFLFNMNVPTRVGFQSPFTNITLDLTVPGYMVDEPAIIGGDLKDNNYSDFADEMDMFNQAFAEVMFEGDAKGRPMTFPIPTINITKDFKWDNGGLDPIWKMTAKYGIPYFSNFINSDMKPDDARSMCPLAGDEKVLIKSSRGRGVEYSTIRNIYEGNSNQEEYEIYSAGKFIKGRFNKWNDQQMIKIRLENGHEIKMSSHHLNYILNDPGENKESVVKGMELKPGMYLPYSLQEYVGSGGTKELGYFVGAYAGDGSIDGDTSVVFSLENHYKKKVITKIIKIAEEYFGAHCTITADKKTKLTTLKVHSKAAVGLCRDYVEGIKRNKKYSARVFTASKEFREGTINGHYDTDGGNRNRIYTSSPQMVETLNMLAATLGTTTSIYEDARKGRLGEEPNYAVLVYKLNRENYGDIWFKKNNKLWVKIKEITPITNSTAYCFEVKNGAPVFTVGTTGVLTHNCRLRLDNRELRKRGGGLFGANPKTGSIGVVTINMPQIGYLSKDDNDFFERLDALMMLAKQSLEIKREIIENLTHSGLHPYSRFYLGDVKKTFGEYWKNHFSTIGLIGMNDALLNFMNKSIGDKEGKEFAEKVLDHMRDKIADFQQETGNIFNLEATPAEGSLAPDEKVLISQSDPRFDEIGPLIDDYLENNTEEIQIVGTSEVLKLPYGEMFTYGFSRKTQKIKKYPVTALVRHLGRSMYEIVTNSGRKVRVTGQHSVFTLNSEGAPEEIRVSDIDVGDPIAVPRQIEMEATNDEFNLIELFKNSSINKYLYGIFSSSFVNKLITDPDVKKWCDRYYRFDWTNVKYLWRKRKVIPLKLIYDLDIKINREVLLSSKIFYRYSKNTKPINTIISIDEDFGFIIGCLLSEGWLAERSQFNNTNKKLAEIFSHSVDKIFGKDTAYISSRLRKKPRKILCRVTLSKVIGLFFKEIGLQGKSNEKQMPNFVFSSNLNSVAGVLRGYYLGDGNFYKNREKNDYSIRLYTNSKELSEGLNLLLLRFGILTKIREDRKSKYNSKWNDNYVISITGAENLQVFFTNILREKLQLSNVHSGRYIISDIPKLIKQIMQKHGIKPSDINIHKDSINKNIRLNRISIQYLEEIIQKLSNHINKRDETLEKLKIIVNSDIYWDKIRRIKKLEPTKYVYDFEVDVKDDLVNNFLGGSGLICLHNTSYRLARIDKAQFPDVRVYNQEKYNGGNGGKSVEPYYTNSSQLPVGFTTDVFEALDLQDSLQSKYTGGTVLHMFLGEEPSPGATKKLVRRVAENYHLPYYTLTPTFSVCPVHGYIAGEHKICPICQKENKKTECEVYSRVVGYLRPVNQWNSGKQQEFIDRKTFDMMKTKAKVKVA